MRLETTDDITDPTPYLPDSDVTAIRTFVRELVAQSIIPTMERHIVQWNEQVLSRRRGMAGRFMSISKRWTPFGSGRSSSSSASSNSNYDSNQGFYRNDAPEAIMRKLADYSFMLRDYKLALSTYEVLRSDFNNDKAWRHYAGAVEMAALSALMPSDRLSSKTRVENIDTWIEAASYNYTTRQQMNTPYYALRSLACSIELLRLRGGSAADDAARWSSRVLELGLVGPIGSALFTERASACFAVRSGIGSMRLGSRHRKAALWSVRAAESWFRLGKALQAEKCLENALGLYAHHADNGEVVKSLPFPEMQVLIDELRQQILGLRLANRGFDENDEADNAGQSVLVEEATETLDASPRVHRKSLIGAAPPLVDVGPLSPTLERGAEIRKDDQFQ
jgi:trafficking protein particle complex subunit 8